MPLQNWQNTFKAEMVFLIVCAFFLGSLTMMNLLGMSRFVDLSFTLLGVTFPLILPIGALPYPITFLCTDIVSEFYGAKRANALVVAGLIANIWIFIMLWLAGLPSKPPLNPQTYLPSLDDPQFAFYQIRFYAMGGMIGSMLAYLIAQFLDVYLYHFWRQVTQGKHLWLRNNGSTMISQLVDTVIVVFVSHWYVQKFPIESGGSEYKQLLTIVFSSYLFKWFAALLDTLPFYLIVIGLKRYFATKEPVPLFT